VIMTVLSLKEVVLIGLSEFIKSVMGTNTDQFY
jgi:hypothetical protein